MSWNRLESKALVSFAALILSLVWLLFAAPSRAWERADDPEARRILGVLRDRLGRIRTIKYQSVIEAEVPARKKPSEKNRITYKNSFALDHDKFFSSLTINNPELPSPIEKLQAFNGKDHQRLDVGKSTLTTQREGKGYQYQGPQPFMMPFTAMLVDDVREVSVFGDLLRQEPWDDLASRSQVVGKEKVGSTDCVVIESQSDKGGATVRMYLAKELDYFPLKVDASRKDRQVLCTVDAYERIVEGDLSLVVPTVVTEVVRPRKVSWSTTTVATVVPGTLEVNALIREAVFTIPKEQAETYFDRANDQWYKDGKLVVANHEDRVEPVARPSIGTPLLIASAGLIVVGLAIRGWRGRRAVENT